MINLYKHYFFSYENNRKYLYTIGLVILSFVLIYPTKTFAGNNKFHTINAALSDTLPTGTPVYWKWATVWGGLEDDASPYISKGTDKSVFVIGHSAGASSVPTTNGVYQSTLHTKSAIFISRFDTTGTLIYSTYSGGLGTNILRDVEVYNNEVYVMYDVANGDDIFGQTLDDLDVDGLGGRRR